MYDLRDVLTRLLELADETFHGTEAFADWLGQLADAVAAA